MRWPLTRFLRPYRPNRTARRARRLRLERLEDRLAPALTPVGPELHVNTFTTSSQSNPNVAADAAGNFVVVWLSRDQDGSGFGIFAQRYNAAGVAQGGEIAVNTFTSRDQLDPAVAMDAAGDFVVAWNNMDPNFYGVFVRRFNAAGFGQGAEFPVNQFTAGNHRDVTVDMDPAGNFVVAWAGNNQDGNGYGVYARQFDAAGSEQGNEFRVNQFTDGDQKSPTVAHDASGKFMVAWTSPSPDVFDRDIYARQYNAAAVPQGDEFRVNTFTTDLQNSPSVAADASGNFVIAWESRTFGGHDPNGDGLFLRRYTSAGVGAPQERVSTITTDLEQLPDVAADAAGDFVVTWQSNRENGNGSDIYAREYPTGGVPAAAEFRVSSFNTGDQGFAAVAVDAQGDAVIVWHSYREAGAGNGFGIYAQRYSVQPQPASSEFRVSTQNIGQQHDTSVAINDIGDFVVAWAGQDGSGFGIFAQRYFADGMAVGGEFRVNTFTTGTQRFPSVAMDSAGDFVVTWASQNQASATSSYDIYAQRYSDAGGALGGEFRVNTFTTNIQTAPAVALNASSGVFIIAWQSTTQDGSGDGIYAQLFLSDGTPFGDEIGINVATANQQRRAAVAYDAAGDGVFAWQSDDGQDGSGFGVIARHSDIGGVPQNEILVNQFTTGVQARASVGIDAAGNFVVAWQSQDQEGAGSGYGIYARRYDNTGAAQGGEFAVNQFTTGRQGSPKVSLDAAGDFVIAWESDGQAGTGLEIFARQYRASGAARGDEFHVNTITTGQQRAPAVAANADGDFVVAWESYSTGGIDGIYAQHYALPDTRAPAVTNIYSSDRTRLLPGQSVITPLTSIAVEFSESMSIAGGAGGLTSVLNSTNYRLTRGGADVSALIASITYGPSPSTGRPEVVLTFSQPLAVGDYLLTVREKVEDLTGHELDGDGDGVPGGDFVRAFTVPPGRPTGPELRYNTTTIGNQDFQEMAMDAAGNFVVVWEQNIPGSLSEFDVFAQRYNAAGVALGGEFRVNAFTTNRQREVAVAMDAAGNFVIAWQSLNQDGPNFDYDIYFRRYNAAGVAQGSSDSRVNGFTTGVQNQPAVAMDSTGNFVIAWQSDGADGDSYGVYAQRYNAMGNVQGGEFQVNTNTTGVQGFPAVAMSATGQFVVTWDDGVPLADGQDGSGYGVYAQRYDAGGVAQGGEFRVNQETTDDQQIPDVDMDSAGNFVIAWESNGQDGIGYGVYARRFNAAGVGLGGEFQVNQFTTGNQYRPAVSRGANGDFVVAWQTDQNDSSDVYAREYAASGAAHGGEFRVNTYTTDSQSAPSVAMHADGDFVVAWTSYAQDGSNDGGYFQRYSPGVDTVAPTVTNVFATNRTPIQPGQSVISSLTSLTSLAVEFSEPMSVGGGGGGPNSVLNPANYGLTRGGVDVSALITGVTFGPSPETGLPEAVLALGAPLGVGDYVLTVRQAIQDLAGNGLDGDGDGSAGGAFTRAFTVPPGQAIGPPFPVNTTGTGDQIDAGVAFVPHSPFYVAWESQGQDGDGFGVYAQRYSSAGVAQGGEFRVNSVTTGNQGQPALANDEVGNFVVAWTSGPSQDGSGYGIYAQRYNVAGVAQGGEFRVNTFTTGDQFGSRVAMDFAGNFVVIWTSTDQDGNGDGIYAQRYNNAGVAQGGEFRVNTATAGNQSVSSVSMNPAGDFVVAWTDSTQDGSGAGVYSRRFSANGTPLGADTLVNQFTTGNQVDPVVAVDTALEFVVAWASFNQEGSGEYGVYARRYNAAGVPQGNEFLVNQFTTGNQFHPALASNAAGDFVVAWESQNQDGAASEIYARQYAASGVPRGGEFRVNTVTTGSQSSPAVAMDAAGDFVAVWNTPDGSGSGIAGQRFGSQSVAAPRVTGAAVNNGSAQRSRLTTLAVTFDAVVTFAGAPEAAFTLTRNSDGAAVTFAATASVVNGVTVVTLNNFTGTAAQFGSLADGRYTLTALASQISAGGQQLDGDGDGQPGGNFTFGDTQGLFRYYGDVNGDRRVDISDFGLFSLAFLQAPNYNAALDFNNDTRIDIADFGQFSVRYFTTLP